MDTSFTLLYFLEQDKKFSKNDLLTNEPFLAIKKKKKKRAISYWNNNKIIMTKKENVEKSGGKKGKATWQYE